MFNKKDKPNNTKKVYSVYDSKAQTYSNPMISLAKGSMTRDFKTLANDKNHPIGKYPEDYTLFEIGEWDEFDGFINMYQAKISLGMAIEYVEQEDKTLPSPISSQ